MLKMNHLKKIPCDNESFEKVTHENKNSRAACEQLTCDLYMINYFSLVNFSPK